jgi:dsDNA-specific endonuclease/ATPase MutS2
VLDLHTFRPEDLGELIPEYLEQCRARGLLEVRIIHGKGIGNVRRSVIAILARLECVEHHAPAGAHFGGSGATVVRLRPAAGPALH